MTLDLTYRLHETVVAGKRLGRAVEFDPRSAGFAIPEVVTGSLVSKLWPRRSPIFDQGQLGSCTGNAGTGTRAADKSSGAPGLATLTEADAVALYEKATKLDSISGSYPPDDTGSSTLGVCKALKADGYITSYLHAMSGHAILSGLQRGGMVTGVPWHTDMDDPDPQTGIVEIGGDIRGGHELHVVGTAVDRPLTIYVEKATGVMLDAQRAGCGTIQVPVGYTIWANSWSVSFGLYGYVLLKQSDHEALLHQHGDAGLPIYG